MCQAKIPSRKDFKMWAFIGILVASVVGVVAAYLLAPSPKTENSKAIGLDEFSVPSNSNGRVVPIIFGTVELKGNCLWYGDLRSKEIRA